MTDIELALDENLLNRLGSLLYHMSEIIDTDQSVELMVKKGEAIKAGAGAIRIKAGALPFLPNDTCRFAHVIKDGFNQLQSVDYI